MTAALARLASARGRLAIDTEFVSERRYQALLCLVQVAVHDPEVEGGVRTEVLDPLDEDDPLDPGPLAAVLADPAVEVVVHAGRQDVAIMRRTWDTDVTNVFDTQIAAAFLGLGAQEGYESLTRRVLGVGLSGGEGFTRWDKRPLDARQLAYAADDARCLLALGEALERELSEVGRLAWAREECEQVAQSDDVRSPARAYERLPNIGRMDDKARAAAWRLCEWREQTARELDRPPPYLLSDQTLVQLARRRPKDKAGLEQTRGLPPQTLHRRAGDVLAAIASARPDDAPPRGPRPPARDAEDAPVISLAQALVRHRTREAKLASELVATQSELSALVGAVRQGEQPSELRVLHGWRRELIGDELLGLLAGRISLAVGPRDGALTIRHEED